MNVPRFDLGPSQRRCAALSLALCVGVLACANSDDVSSDDAGVGAQTGSGGSSGAAAHSGSGGTSAMTGAGGSPITGEGGSGGTANPTGEGGAAGSSTNPTGTAGTKGAAGQNGTSGAAGHTDTSGAAGTNGGAGHAGTSGAAGTTGTGNASGSGKDFSQCRFHFGTIDSVATNKANASNIIPQLDMFTPGWMGLNDTFDMGYVCTEAKAGGALANQVPVIVAYVAAFYVKRHAGLCDCNVTSCGAKNDLCHTGSAQITANLTNILNVYKSYAQGFASCYGTTRPIIFEMEPDFYQYTYTGIETQPFTFAQAGQLMSQFVGAIKAYLPNAVFSMDISPWVGTNNNTGGDGSDNGKNWYSYFDMTQFTFINTSGGGTDAATAKIRGDAMTWSGVNQVTGKPILADTGYGTGGQSTGLDPAWDTPANINARIADGVVGVTQYDPSPSGTTTSTWGTTIAGIRSQLTTPRYCP